jgi:hypothetical protein
MGTPEEWADRLAKRQEEKRITHQSHDAEVAKVQKLITEKFPLLWEELMQAFSEYCKAYNDRIKPERTLHLFKELDRFVIKPDALGDIVNARLDRQINRILIATTLSKESYRASVGMRDDGIVYLSSESGGTHTPAEIAEKTLNSLLDK